MTQHQPAQSGRSSESDQATSLTRRRFLGAAAGLGAMAAAPPMINKIRGRGSERSQVAQVERDLGTIRQASSQRARAGELIVVTIQQGGGNDNLNTLVPLNSGAYRDLRRDGAIQAENTVPIDADYGLFAMPYLASQWDQGDVAIVHGVGYEGSTLSHFDDTDVWEKGDTDYSTPTGWLGRALHAVGNGQSDPLLGMSLGGLSPSMLAPGWNPVALPDLGSVPWTADDRREWASAAKGFERLVQPDRTDSPLAAAVRRGQSEVFELADLVGAIFANRQDYEQSEQPMTGGSERFFPGEEYVTAGELGEQLVVVADLINAGVPTRAFHVYQDGYDTHGDQNDSHPQLIRQLDLAIEAFHKRLGAKAEKVVIATWTEFGRTPEWNGSGTDHGTAGMQFVVGQHAAGGHHGEAPSLTNFDRDGNFIVTTDFRSYLGGVVEGALGVAAGDVFDSKPRSLEVVS